jgi:hypothetical protein
MKGFKDYLNEAFWVKVNSKGEKARRLKCPEGYKLNDGGTACVPIPSAEKQDHRVAAKKMIRTKKAEGASLKKRALIKTKRALKFRKGYGL